MKQRMFSFMATHPKPVHAADSVVAKIRDEPTAFVTSLKFRHGGLSDRTMAQMLGISAPYFNQIKKGARSVPYWMVAPFCALTGTTLLAQWRDLQEVLRMAQGKETARELTSRLADELRRAA